MYRNLVAVIDSGIDVSNKNIIDKVDYMVNIEKSKYSIKLDYNNVQDNLGHGTNCVDTILQVEPASRFYIIKIINKDGLSSSSLLLEALKLCIHLPVKVICISLSITSLSCKYEKELFEICEILFNKNKILCVSDNNNFSNSLPAIFKNVIGVKAHYEDNILFKIDESKDIQVEGLAKPIYVQGINNNFNFFKGSSKANAMFTGYVVRELLSTKEDLNLNKVILNLKNKFKNSYNENYEVINDKDIYLDLEYNKEIIDYIVYIKNKFSEQKNLSFNDILQKPIIYDGVSFFNFYMFFELIIKKFNMKIDDYHKLKIDDVCTLPNLVNFIKRGGYN